MNIFGIPILGGTAPRTATRTAEKLAGFALRHTPRGHAYLDVGCGNGHLTEMVASKFREAIGIDVEPERLTDFRAHVNGKFSVLEMSGDSIKFHADSFCLVTAFEVLEHVRDLEATVSEMIRVCAPGGIIVVSVPQIWFLFENHGMRIGSRIYERKIPLLPYLRPLHRRLSLARLFSSVEMDNLFSSLIPVATEYATPQFERAAASRNGWERKLRFLRKALDHCESIPVLRALFGVSMLKAYRKPLVPRHQPVRDSRRQRSAAICDFPCIGGSASLGSQVE